MMPSRQPISRWCLATWVLAFYIAVGVNPPGWGAYWPNAPLLVCLAWGLQPGARSSSTLWLPWVVGLLVDLVNGGLLGSQAMVLLTVQYLSSQLSPQIFYLHQLQRWLWASLFLLGGQLAQLALLSLFGLSPLNPVAFAAQPCVGMLLWPLVYRLVVMLAAGHSKQVSFQPMSTL